MAEASLLPETNPMLSYHNDPALKAKYVTRAQAHRAADELVQGTGWDGKNGCAIGCLAEKYPAHEDLARDIGADEALFHLADSIHEGLPGHLAKTWPERFAAAIPVGADLSRVRWQFCGWLLTDAEVNPGITDEAVSAAVKGVADLCLRAAMGEMPAEDEWSAARAAARAAAESAARSAARAAARAAWSAESARSAAWERMSERLLVLLAATEGPRP